MGVSHVMPFWFCRTASDARYPVNILEAEPIWKRVLGVMGRSFPYSRVPKPLARSVFPFCTRVTATPEMSNFFRASSMAVSILASSCAVSSSRLVRSCSIFWVSSGVW